VANEPVGARARGVGAVARGDGRKRRGLWLWLLAGLLLLAVIAGVLIALLSGSSHHAKRAAAHSVPASAPVTPTTGAAGQAAAVASGQSSTTQTAGSAALAGLPAAGQIGGDGVAAHPATGRLAAAGSIGVILFAEAGIGLDRPAHMVVATAVKEIRARHSTTVTVTGYTDSIGNPKANRTLSLERAHQVVTALQRQLGNTTTKFTAEARGQTHPVAPNTTAKGRQLDRRVEIWVKP
jgi:outer membrane protein OmpA-like peptidoglycan-associated protein